jgi:hypothetical protein
MERGIPPEVSRNRALVYALTRLTLAFIWFYHGIVPKLLYRSADELRMLRDTGVPESYVVNGTLAFGWLEVGIALTLLIFWWARWPLWMTIVAMCAATIGVGIYSPDYFHNAFNPLTLNLAVAALAACGLLVAEDLPSARKCRRKPPEG